MEGTVGRALDEQEEAQQSTFSGTTNQQEEVQGGFETTQWQNNKRVQCGLMFVVVAYFGFVQVVRLGGGEREEGLAEGGRRGWARGEGEGGGGDPDGLGPPVLVVPEHEPRALRGELVRLDPLRESLHRLHGAGPDPEGAELVDGAARVDVPHEEPLLGAGPRKVPLVLELLLGPAHAKPGQDHVHAVRLAALLAQVLPFGEEARAELLEESGKVPLFDFTQERHLHISS